MRPRERSLRGLIDGLVVLCLVLLGGATRAAAIVPEAGPVSDGATASTRQAPSTADLFDCAPCVACCVAPPPSLHTHGGEPRAPDEPSWPTHAAEGPPRAAELDSGGWRACMPVRIAFCRWLD